MSVEKEIQGRTMSTSMESTKIVTDKYMLQEKYD
jgi:hypothetical protein